MDVGLAKLLLLLVPVWWLATIVVYWVSRLAVRHRTLDAYRIDRGDQRIAKMRAATERQQATYGGSEPG